MYTLVPSIFAIVLIISLAVAAPVPKATVSALIVRYRSDSQCHVIGYSDLYGLGIRLGIYAQWITGLLAYRYFRRALETVLVTNTLFLLAASVATVKLGVENQLHPVELIVMVHIAIGFVISTVAYDKSGLAGWIFRKLLHLGVFVYATRFWTYESPRLRHGLDCSTSTFLFAKVEVGSAVEIFEVIVCIIFLCKLGLEFVIRVLYITFRTVSAIKFGEARGWLLRRQAWTALNEDFVHNWVFKIEKSPAQMWPFLYGIFGRSKRFQKVNEAMAGKEFPRNETENGSNSEDQSDAGGPVPGPLGHRLFILFIKSSMWLIRFWRGLYVIWSIIAIETTLAWNHVSETYTVTSTGQLIPLLDRIGYKLYAYMIGNKDKHVPAKHAEAVFEYFSPLGGMNLRLWANVHLASADKAERHSIADIPQGRLWLQRPQFGIEKVKELSRMYEAYWMAHPDEEQVEEERIDEDEVSEWGTTSSADSITSMSCNDRTRDTFRRENSNSRPTVRRSLDDYRTDEDASLLHETPLYDNITGMWEHPTRAGHIFALWDVRRLRRSQSCSNLLYDVPDIDDWLPEHDRAASATPSAKGRPQRPQPWRLLQDGRVMDAAWECDLQNVSPLVVGSLALAVPVYPSVLEWRPGSSTSARRRSSETARSVLGIRLPEEQPWRVRRCHDRTPAPEFLKKTSLTVASVV